MFHDAYVHTNTQTTDLVLQNKLHNYVMYMLTFHLTQATLKRQLYSGSRRKRTKVDLSTHDKT